MLASRVSRTFSSSPPRALAGITLDGLACLALDTFACDPAATSMTVAFWTKTARDVGGSSFGEILNWVDTGGSPGASQIQISSQGQLSHSGGSPGRVDWANDAVTNYRTAAPPWPGAAFIQGHTDDDSTPNDDLWMLQLMSFDITPRAPLDWLTGYINGVSTIGLFSDPFAQQVVGPDTALNINGLTLSVGGTTLFTDEDGLVGEIMNIWAGVGVDLRETDGTFSDATINLFMGPGNTPKYLGDNGELVTGSPADLYLSRYDDEDVTAFFVNKGTAGGPFTIYNARGGDVVASTTPNPSGEPRPVPISCDVTGLLTVGETLTVHPNFTFSPTGTSFQWQNGQLNEGTDDPSFVNEIGDVGFLTSCIMTVSNGSGSFVSNSIFVGPIT